MGNFKCVTGRVRLVYIGGLKEKTAPVGSDRLRYNVNVLIDKGDTISLTELERAFKEAVADGKEKLWKNRLPAGLKFENFLRDRSEESDQEFWEGNWSIVPKSLYEPAIIDRENNRIKADNEKVYDGMYARVSMSLYPYSHESGGKGVGVQLNSVKALEGGPRIELTYDAAKDFEDEFEDEVPQEKKKRKRKAG